MTIPANRGRTRPPGPVELIAALSQRVVGQDEAIRAVAPYVQLFQAGLSPEGRPVGAFLLLGPTGTGKTRTVEALADVLHGSERNLLRIDCGEYQMEHEVAKLIGAPPGYLGHRETQPMLTQHKLNAVSSDRSALSLVLFDEIEKAAASLNRLLLGVLDKAALRLGDNTSVNFERSLIFLTSNLGAREISREISAGFGFSRCPSAGTPPPARKLHSLAMNAVRRRFSPEFITRIVRILTYQPLGPVELDRILDQQLSRLKRHIRQRLTARSFDFVLTPGAREFLLEHGASREYGARELKRAIHRFLLQPISSLVAAGHAQPGATLRVTRSRQQHELAFHFTAGGRKLPDAA